MRSRRFKYYKQLESLDCAPACLKMIAHYHGREYSLEYLRDICKSNRLGTSVFSLTTGAEKIELEAVAVELLADQLTDQLPLPCVLLVNNKHFVVLVEIINKRDHDPQRRKFKIADPGFGMITINAEELCKKWLGTQKKGVCIFFEPTENFLSISGNIQDKVKDTAYYWLSLKRIFQTYRAGLFQIILGMILSSVLSIAFPILTQRMVDVGIHYKSYEFIWLVFLFQLGIFVSMVIVDLVKAWVLLHIGAKIELGLTYDFLSKIMKLPLYFFEVKVAADLMQRIGDNSRIQVFIKNQLLDFIIAIATFITLSTLMASYNGAIYTIFITLTLITAGWTLYFTKKREILDYRRFDVTAENTDNIIETIVAMPEIRINNAELIKRDRWERIQIRLFEINAKILSVQQYQNSGAAALNTVKNLTVTFLSVQQVLSGSLSLGEMLGISAIIGQLNVPVNQILTFWQNLQDAKISFARLSEIQSKKEEDEKFKEHPAPANIRQLLAGFDAITINNLGFSYIESEDDLLFDNLSLSIPKGKITAVVGLSGSGKTTLLKLLLKFYEPLRGNIAVGGIDLADIPADLWRQQCGVVMQEGHIFSDTVENNIAMATEEVDEDRLVAAANLACAHSFIERLPMKYKTKIGSSGLGLSTGQKQRLLIARAIYKNPEILIFDEATSSLDANNERTIQENLQTFFLGKTVIIIAHRLSTVRNADNIVVMESGSIIEQSSHDQLVNRKGAYYQLVKNQLELGN